MPFRPLDVSNFGSCKNLTPTVDRLRRSCRGLLHPAYLAYLSSFISEPPKTRTWNLEIKSLCRRSSSGCWKLHKRELSPTIYDTLPLGIDETVGRLREALQEAEIEIIDELDLSSLLDGERAYKVLLAADREFLQLAAGANLGAATLALLKVAVYEEDGETRVEAIEPEKAAAQIRNSEVNERGLELRKRFIRVIKTLKHASTGVKQ